MGIYEHYKGKLYQVIGSAIHTETGELLVIYQEFSKKSCQFFARPKHIFNENIEVNGKLVPRFKFLYVITI